MNIIISILAILTPVCGGIWVLANKNYNYFNEKFYTFLYCFSALWLIPFIWNITIFFIEKKLKNKIDKTCFTNIENILTEFKTSFETDTILSVTSLFGMIFLIIIMKALRPN